MTVAKDLCKIIPIFLTDNLILQRKKHYGMIQEIYFFLFYCTRIISIVSRDCDSYHIIIFIIVNEILIDVTEWVALTSTNGVL